MRMEPLNGKIRQLPGIYLMVTGVMDSRTTMVVKINAQMIAEKVASDSTDPMI